MVYNDLHKFTMISQFHSILYYIIVVRIFISIS